MISVIATIQTKPGQQDEFLTTFKQLIPEVLAEDGCLEYFPAIDIHSGIDVQDAVRTDCVTVLEKWASVAALRVHLSAPHMHEFRERTQHLVESLSIQVVQAPI